MEQLERGLSIRIDQTLYRRLALEKAHSGQSFQELVTEALETLLDERERERRAREI